MGDKNEKRFVWIGVAIVVGAVLFVIVFSWVGMKLEVLFTGSTKEQSETMAHLNCIARKTGFREIRGDEEIHATLKEWSESIGCGTGHREESATKNLAGAAMDDPTRDITLTVPELELSAPGDYEVLLFQSTDASDRPHLEIRRGVENWILDAQLPQDVEIVFIDINGQEWTADWVKSD